MLAGLLRKLVLICCASSCSGINPQRTSRERGCLNSATYNHPNSNFGGVASFEPGGQGFESLRAHFLSKKVLRQPGAEDRKRADRTPDRQQDGSTTRRRAGLDVAASAAAVRSEAEDERRSREQSVRAL